MSVEIERDKIVNEVEIFMNSLSKYHTWIENLIKTKNYLIDRLATSEEKVRQLSQLIKSDKEG